jgi:hypothetical protein
MRICPYCAYSNREGIFYCEDCGETLVGQQAGVMTSTRLLKNSSVDLPGANNWGTARLDRYAEIQIRIHDGETIAIKPADEIVLGRADAAAGLSPGIDLTPHGAQEKGVSRVHAALKRGDETLVLVDLGSVNGTHLNGQKLSPNQPRVVRDGDEIRLGMLSFNIFFK